MSHQARWASPNVATTSNSEFPNLPSSSNVNSNHVKSNRIVSSTRNGNSYAGQITNQNAPFSVPNLESVQGRLAAIPGIEQAFARFNSFVSELETATDETARMNVMFKFLMPQNA